MTSPQQPEPTQAQQDNASRLLAGILAANAVAGVAGLPPQALLILARLGITTQVAQAVAQQAPSVGGPTYVVALRKLLAPVAPSPVPGASALADQVAQEPAWNARYLVAATQRVQAAINGGKTLDEALADEAHNASMHEQAQAQRRATAAKVVSAGKEHGRLLGWHLGDRKQHTADCLAATGHNFSADEQPKIGWPGSVHFGCGCAPGVQFASRISVDDATRPFWKTDELAA